MKQRKRMISIIAVIMAVLMLLSLVASVIPSAFAISQSDIDALQAKKDEISARVREAEARVDTLKEAQANVLDQKAALEEKNDAAKEALRLVGEEIVMYDGIIEEKTEELNLALNREQTQLTKYRTRVRAMEETGGYNILTVLMSSGDFNEFLTALDDMEKIVIDKPTMIKVPGLFWHGPLEIVRLGKPLFFQPVLFNSRYYAIHQRYDKEGRPYKEAITHGISPCKLDSAKTCTFCGRCRERKEV